MTKSNPKPDRISRRQRDAIILSLSAGVVPRVGQQHIQVGRDREVEALRSDLDRIIEGGSTCRFVVGEYGRGKSFFLNLVRSMALGLKMVTLHCDLSPDHRLHSSGGHARNLYAEMMRNASIRAKQDGGAITTILERFINEILINIQEQDASAEDVIRQRLSPLQDLTGGYEFADVILQYWEGHDTGTPEIKIDAVRWIRGEFRTIRDARASLRVSTIISDQNWYDSLKLFAGFVRIAGFAGTLVCFDEMESLYKLSNVLARKNNYKQLLRIFNDCTQGTAESMGLIFGCTPETLLDPRRGIFSHEALGSRLAENIFTTNEIKDYSKPVLRLDDFSPEELFVLLRNLRHVFASGKEDDYLVPDEALVSFMRHCASRIGDAYFQTPRTTIKGFVDLLAVLEQNPHIGWENLMERVELAPEVNPDLQPLDDEGETPADDNDELADIIL